MKRNREQAEAQPDLSARRIGREVRGLKSYLCKGCREGVLPGREKNFDPRCEGCLTKKSVYDRLQAHCGLPADGEHHVMCATCAELARKPMRTGKEPLAKKCRGGNVKWRALSAEQKAAVVARHEKANAARRKHERATTVWRRDDVTT